jgi:hypothetical protein
MAIRMKRFIAVVADQNEIFIQATFADRTEIVKKGGVFLIIFTFFVFWGRICYAMVWAIDDKL